jgi:hypothetical protein
MIQLALGLLVAAQLASADAFAETAPQPILVSQVQVADPAAGREASDEVRPPVQPRIYQPPRTGQPRDRLAGGDRGGSGVLGAREPLEPVARPLSLAPGHVAQTLSPRPHLYWSIDRPHAGKVILTLSSRDATEPHCELELPSPARAGAQSVDLAACPADLEVGTEYEWFVAVVADPQKRSRDRISQGWIRRVPPPEGFDAAHASPGDLAGRGLWYDALHAAATRSDRAAWQSLMGELSISTVDLP